MTAPSPALLLIVASSSLAHYGPSVAWTISEAGRILQARRPDLLLLCADDTAGGALVWAAAEVLERRRLSYRRDGTRVAARLGGGPRWAEAQRPAGDARLRALTSLARRRQDQGWEVEVIGLIGEETPMSETPKTLRVCEGEGLIVSRVTWSLTEVRAA